MRSLHANFEFSNTSSNPETIVFAEHNMRDAWYQLDSNCVTTTTEGSRSELRNKSTIGAQINYKITIYLFYIIISTSKWKSSASNHYENNKIPRNKIR